MIIRLTDMRLPATFLSSPAKPLRSNRIPRELASSCENRIFGQSLKRLPHVHAADVNRCSLSYGTPESPPRHVRYCEDVQS